MAWGWGFEGRNGGTNTKVIGLLSFVEGIFLFGIGRLAFLGGFGSCIMIPVGFVWIWKMVVFLFWKRTRGLGAGVVKMDT